MAFKFLALGALALVQLLTISSVQATSAPKTVCYYESWVHWRHGDGKMDPVDIDYKLCTHMVYATLGIDNNHELKLLDAYLANDLHDLRNFVQAKGTSKALISVGGSSHSQQFSSTAESDHSRTTFVKSVINFCAKHGFDGVIIDWYAMPQGDGENLVKLLDKFDELLASTPYVLAITLPVTQATYDWYNVQKIAQYVDFINVITFDYTGSWAKQVGHASPMSLQLGTLEEYHKRGAPRSKLLMSVPLYGRTWKLANPEKQEVGDEATGPGHKGPFTDVDGVLSYNELCVMIKNNPQAFSLIRDPKEHAVHAVYTHGSTTEWITFEDTKTLASKAKNITEMGYAGMTIYAISNEDTHGVCGKKNPLLHAINDNYFRGSVTEKPQVVTPHPTVPHVPVTDNPKGPFHCRKVGKFRDHLFCFKYFDCQEGSFAGTFEQIEMFCERHEAFDEHLQKCVDAKTVPGCH